MLEKYDTDELLEGMFNITFKTFHRYQWEYPGLISKHKCAKYKTGVSWRQAYYPDFNIQGLNSYSAEISKIFGLLVSHLYPS